MFLHELTDPQREAFMCLAARMASADARLDDDELALLSQMRHEMDIPASWRPSTATTAELLGRFTDHRARSVVLLELLRLARIDNQLADRERTFFLEAAASFQFTRRQVEAIVQWLRRYEALMREANVVLNPPVTRIQMPTPPRND